MGEVEIQNNVEVYDAAEVAAYYAALNYLSACERILFETYIPAGSAVLDLGVGAGRTTPFLSRRAARYIGLDYSKTMIEHCRIKFPNLQFTTGDAADLSVFPDSHFDAVVFAYNGIDFVLGEGARARCLEHVARLLKPGGTFIFSSHNPRAIWVRPSWNRNRLRKIARQLFPKSSSARVAALAALTLIRYFLALCTAAVRSSLRSLQRLWRPEFWRGEGCFLDSAHGGLFTHYATPHQVVSEFRCTNLRVLRILGDDYPATSHLLATDWYYYVFHKTLK
jgi:ubiquinone/menaquinone biosynthesis C-methylase UbiE